MNEQQLTWPKDRAVWRTDKGESSSMAAKEMKAVCERIYQRMALVGA